MGAVCCRAQPIDFDGEVTLFHFRLLKVVGKGAFGKVRMVQHKQNRASYALKYINKIKAVRMRAVGNIIQERRLLEKIDHPFVVNLRFAFQDDENCFFVLDLMLGGDLRFHMLRDYTFSEETIRFYAAQLSSALIYLHQHRIIHRDIKPDNILLDEDGHAHLTDFNVASYYSITKPLTSVAGSMAYIAPEVISRRGYTFTPDWWSLGVTLYEVLFGIRPFNGRNGQELMANIDKGELPEFFRDPKEKCSPMGIEVLRGLVEKDKDARLCCKDGIAGLSEIKKMPWFDGMDWTLLEEKKLIPPMRPNGKGNFDPAHELEEILLEDNPLRAKRRTKEFETMSPEMKRMEEQFLPYNFRHTIVERSSSSDITAVPHRPVSPGTPVIDRGFENMIDHRSIINQPIDSPLRRRHDHRNSDDSLELGRVPPLPNGISASTEKPRVLPAVES